jgi:hypothetical protein
MAVGTQHQIGCPNCARSGATCKTLAEAIADWNRQTAAPDYHRVAKILMGYADNPTLGEMYLAAKYLLDHTVFGTEIQLAIMKAEPKP